MKKVLLLALAVWAGAAFHTAQAGDKKKKKQQATEQTAAEQPVTLTTPSDSVSFAAGMSFTQGLEGYLKQQYGLDSIQTKGFMEGFKSFMSLRQNPDFNAIKAGIDIASMVESRMLPGISKEFADSKYAINADMFYSGFEAALRGDHTLYTDSAAQAFVEKCGKELQEQKNKAWREQNEQWLAENKKKEGVITTASGLQYKVIKQGTGAMVTDANQEVTVKYEGKDIDGNVFDSSYKRNPQTSDFKPSQVIKGWTEALMMMPEGSTWELYIPQELAYGERAAGSIKPFSTLIFKVELISAKKAETDVKKDEKKDTKKPAAKPAAKKTTPKRK